MDKYDENGSASLYESAFDPVSDKKRKPLISLTMVLAGYPIALSNFVIGGAVGVGMTFKNAVITLLIGNAFLMGIVICTGLMAFKTGLSTSFLSRRAFGKNGSSIFSALLAISGVTWISMNADIFARLIKSTFLWWTLPVSITAIICVVLWTQSAIRGFQGLEIISFLGVPAALLMSIVGIIAVGRATGSFAGLLQYIPQKEITFTAATSSIIGGWIFGATITPDVCRFAKSKKDLVIACLVAFTIGCLGLQFAGAIVAISTGNGDFTVAMAALGLSLVAFIAAVFCLWTTQDNNIYGASLAVQNILEGTPFKGKASHKQIVLIISGLAAMLAGLGIFRFILPIIQFLSLLIPPVPGIMISEEFIVKNPQHHKKINSQAIIAWIIGGLAAYLSLKSNIFIPPLAGILSSSIIYAILGQFNK